MLLIALMVDHASKFKSLLNFTDINAFMSLISGGHSETALGK